MGYYEQYVEPIHELTAHRIPTVRRWARRMVGVLRDRIEDAHDEDAEHDAKWDI